MTNFDYLNEKGGGGQGQPGGGSNPGPGGTTDPDGDD